MAEPIGSAYVEVRADLSSLERDSADIAARLRRALAPPEMGDDYRAVGAKMRRELGVGVDGAQADTVSSFKTAAARSDDALKTIGGAGDFTKVKREAAQAGDSIKSNMKTAADESDGHLNRMGGTGTRVFRNLIGLAAAYGGMRVFTGAISQASNLNESINAVNVTFGDNAAAIQALGDQAATSMGLTKNEFNGVAVSFANFATAVAGPGGDVGKTMQAITGRAADFASVMNLDVNTANDLFRSGLAGESEPLRKYGIDISEASVKAFAYANGIAKTGAELDANQKVQARYGLIMQQTNKVQGDFANTSGELANGMRILRANALETAATFGSAFLPSLKGVVGGLNEMVKGLAAPLADLGTAVGASLGPVMTAIGPVIGIVVTQLSKVVTDIGSMIGSLAPLLSPIVQVIGVIVTALSGGLTAAFKALEPAIKVVADFLNVFADHLGGALMDGLDAITPALTTLGQLLGGALARVLPMVMKMFDELAPILIQIAQILTDALLAALPGLISAFEQIAAVLLPLVPILANGLLVVLQDLQPILPILIDAFVAWKVASSALAVAQGVYTAIVGIFTVETAGAAVALEGEALAASTAAVATTAFTLPVAAVVVAIAALALGVYEAYLHFQGFHDVVDKAWQIMQSVWDFITNFFVVAWHDLQAAVHLVVDVVQEIWDRSESFRSFLASAFSVVLLAFKLQWDVARGAVELVIGILVLLWNNTLGPLADFIAGHWSNIMGVMKLGWSFTRDAIGEVVSKAQFFWHTIMEPLLVWIGGAFNTGMGIAKTILGDIRDAFQWVIDKVEFLITKAKDLIGILGKITNPFGGAAGSLAADFAKANAGASGVPHTDVGRIVTSPMLSWLGEQSRPEVVVPMTNPRRAVDLMAQSGIGAMWDRANANSGPAVNIESAVFQDATDADLVGQRVYAATVALRLSA